MASPPLILLWTRMREDGQVELCPRFVGNGLTLAADDLFRAKLQLLSEAHEAADRELEPLVLASTIDKQTLRPMRDRIHGLAEQTDALLLVMVRFGAAKDLIGAAEKLFDFFREYEEWIEALLQSGRLMRAGTPRHRRRPRPEPSAHASFAPPLLSLRDRRVLVVEDELLLFDEMKDELESEGAEVLGPAPSLAEALALLAAGPAPDAAILDINLAGEMVYPVAETLRTRRIPFIFATGYGARVIPQAFAQVPLLEKPVPTRRLFQTLRARMASGPY